jgi:hypothetical protein
VTLRNNVGRTAIALQAGGGQTVRLHRNTLIPYGTGLLTLFDLDGLQTVTVEAEKNIFGNGTLVLIPDARSRNMLKERLRWTGKDNLYEATAAAIRDNHGKCLAQGLAQWDQFWGRKENGSRQAGRVFWQWDAPRRQKLDSALHFLQTTAESLRRKPSPAPADFGPKWDLVGPGEPYVRALAAQRKSAADLASDALRPKPPPGGPFVVRGKPIRGHATLQEAVATAAVGEMIEIRGDGPFLGLSRDDAKDGKDIFVRAAQGYLPVIEGDIVLSPQDTFSAEGIRFHGRIWSPGKAHIRSLANCVLDDPANLATFSTLFAAGAREPAEITNCLIRPMLSVGLLAGNKLVIRNSVLVDAFSLVLPEKGAIALEMEDCLLWHTAPHSPVFQTVGKGQVAISCTGTVFETCGPLLNGDRTARFSGVRNVYCCGLRSWCGDKYVLGLDAWKESWASSEDGSVELEPLDYDPAQWQLLRSAPGGNDFGADVNRIAVTR